MRVLARGRGSLPACILQQPPHHRQQPPGAQPLSTGGPGPAPGHSGWNRGILPTWRPGVTYQAAAALLLQGRRVDKA